MKVNKAKLCFWLSGILMFLFLLKNSMDFLVYSNTLNSAPFWVSILVNGIYLLIPALIALICGCYFQRKGQ